MTYRTGNHWGVTIVREPDHGGDCFDTCNGHPAAQLVAVVVNGDQALATRIAALLTIDERCWHGEHCPGSGPDCERDAPLKGGHRDCADAWHANHGCCTEPYDGDAPETRLRSTESAQEPPGVPVYPLGGLSASEAGQNLGENLRRAADLAQVAAWNRGDPAAIERAKHYPTADPAITSDRRCRKCGTAVESVTAEPHGEMAHPGGYMVWMSVVRTLHPCGHAHFSPTGAVI